MKGTFVGRGEKQAKVNRRYLAEDIIMSYWRAEVFLRVYISGNLMVFRKILVWK
jgi:hypothetical protein